MAIKLSKKKVAAYNKTQTTPKTPSKVVPFIDRMTVGINFEANELSEGIHSNIWAQVADTAAFTQTAKVGSYNAAWRIKIPSAVKLKHYPFMQYRHADKCAARISLSFSPHDLGEDGLDEMHVALTSLVPDGWVSFVELGNISMIEVSADFPGVPVDSFHVLPQQTTTVKTWSNNGKLETLLLGKKAGNQTRIYDRAQKRMSKKQAWQAGDCTRVERILRQQSTPVKALLDLKNPFAGIEMVALPPSPPPEQPKSKEYVWHLFCDAVEVRGLPSALKLLPANTYRQRYRAWFKQHPQPWWQPDAIWKEWKPMIEKSRLANTDWI